MMLYSIIVSLKVPVLVTEAETSLRMTRKYEKYKEAKVITLCEGAKFIKHYITKCEKEDKYYLITLIDQKTKTTAKESSNCTKEYNLRSKPTNMKNDIKGN
jgi:hypothetical protein